MSRDYEVSDVESSNDGTSDEERKSEIYEELQKLQLSLTEKLTELDNIMKLSNTELEKLQAFNNC